MTFKPWEVPTLGESPIRLAYREVDGRRVVLNQSWWVLLIRRANGDIEPLARTAWLDPGDEVLQEPQSHTEPVEQEVINLARREGLAAYSGNQWWWYRRELPHGRVLHLAPGGHNSRLTLSLVDAVGPEGSWCYTAYDEAWQAVLGWNGEGDPPDGWIRHIQSGRRRHDGTTATEFWNRDDAPAGVVRRRQHDRRV